MAKKRRKILGFPVGGVDQATPESYQRQSTVLDAFNVLPRDQLDLRVRGGSRPGVVPMIWGGPASRCTLLKTIEGRPDEREAEWYEDFDGDRMRPTLALDDIGGWSSIDWSTNTTPNLLSAPLLGPDSFLALPSGVTTAGATRTWQDEDARDTTNNYGYEIALMLSPPSGGQFNSTDKVYIAAMLDDTSPQPFKDSALLHFYHTGSDWHLVYRDYENFTGANGESASQSDSDHSPGWLIFRYYYLSGGAYGFIAWWKGNALAGASPPLGNGSRTPKGHGIGIIIDGANAPRIDAMRIRYFKNIAVASPRKRLVAVFENGSLYRQARLEDGEVASPTSSTPNTDTLVQVGSTGDLAANERHEAAEFQGSLYITDGLAPKYYGDCYADSALDAIILTREDVSASVGDYVVVQFRKPATNNVEGVYEITGVVSGSGKTTLLIQDLNGDVPAWTTDDQYDSLDGQAVATVVSERAKVYVPKYVPDANNDSYTTDKIIDWDEAKDRNGNYDPAGFVPVGCPLIATFQDRLVLAGNPQNAWYMSRRNVPNDFNYYATDDGRAVAGTLSDTGSTGEPMTALIPFGDDYLVFGGRSSLWVMRGDPVLGGTLNNISRSVGVAGPRAWCHTPNGGLVFLARSGGLYMLAYELNRGWFPVPLSGGKIPKDLSTVDLARDPVLAFDRRLDGVWLFNGREPRGAEHSWFIDWPTKSFWRQYIRRGHSPASIVELLAPGRNDCGIVYGTGSGRIMGLRMDFAGDAPKTSGGVTEVYANSAWIIFGPLSNGMLKANLTLIRATLDPDSAPVAWSVHRGDTADDILDSDNNLASGTWNGGRNYANRPRIGGQRLALRLDGDGSSLYPWALDEIEIDLRHAGEPRKL